MIPLDFEDPDRVWNFHYTYAPGYPFGSEALTARNLANGLAKAVYVAQTKAPGKCPSWTDLAKDAESEMLIAIPAVRRLEYQISGKEIIVKDPKSQQTFHYPLIGPAATNSKLNSTL